MNRPTSVEHYKAGMLLSGVGDAIGYRNQQWEYNQSGPAIHQELQELGGLDNICAELPDWPVSDDTVLHLATAEALATGKEGEELLHTVALGYIEGMKDMEGRKPGPSSILGISQLQPGIEGGKRIPYNPEGTGCGAAMRSMCIGLRYPHPEQLSLLVEVAVETGRMTHPHPTGFLGAVASALFAAYAVQQRPIMTWGLGLLEEACPVAKTFIQSTGYAVTETQRDWDYFIEKWKWYLDLRGLSTGTGPVNWPDQYGPAERDEAYKSFSLSGWAGRSGHDAPMIALDALLGAGSSWEKLMSRAGLHGGNAVGATVYQVADVHTQHYDVIVVGGGHAGTEAAAAASRVGANTLLITQKIQTIGALSCNPSLGGVGKGHLVKEIDALDGVMGRAGDWAGIHFSILNRSKGPAVWGPRAQLDRRRYRDFIQSELLSTEKLAIIEGAVEDLLVSAADPDKPERHKVYGICLAHGGGEIHSRSVVLTTGTFLSGSLFMGPNSSPGGRIGDPPSCVGLSYSLKEILGLKIGRLRTGTPPRIIKDTIDFSYTEIRLPDEKPTPFSFINTCINCKPEDQLPCFLTHTTPGVERVVNESIHDNSHIQQDTKGPRYCPSVESKVLRFPGRQHQVWLEPEGWTSDLMYPQGLSMTMPPDKQLCLIREIPGLRKAQIHTPGYGVQYDFVCPTQLYPWLQVKSTQGLFLAGQINGTTGYEEAGAQGLWAGVNAGRTSLSKVPLSLSRTQSYIGVLIDDLVGRGVTEPYRMFTSRAEFRTLLRPDNADMRLTLRGFEEIGCVSKQRYNEALRVKKSLNEGLSALRTISLSATRWRTKLQHVNISETKSTILNGEEVLHYKEVSFKMLASAFPDILAPYLEFSERIKVEALYHPHCEKQRIEIERMQAEESLYLPQDIDYLTLPVSLSKEVREILDRARPNTLGAASRLPGITPAAIVHLLNYVQRKKHRNHGTGKDVSCFG